MRTRAGYRASTSPPPPQPQGSRPLPAPAAGSVPPQQRDLTAQLVTGQDKGLPVALPGTSSPLGCRQAMSGMPIVGPVIRSHGSELHDTQETRSQGLEGTAGAVGEAACTARVAKRVSPGPDDGVSGRRPW